MGNDTPAHGHDAASDLRGELYRVQRQLSRITTSRLSYLLSVEEEHAYRLLAHREVELILELADNPLAPSSPRPARPLDGGGVEGSIDQDLTDDAMRQRELDRDIWLESSGPEVSFS